MNNMGNVGRLYFTVRDSFGDNIGAAQYASFDAAKEILEKYCSRTDVDVDGAWMGVVYKGEGKDIKCALVQNHVTPNYNRFRSMYTNLSERALAVPEIELAALHARQMEFPFDERTQKRIDELEKQLGIFEREVKTSGDLYVGKWRVHIVPPGGRYGSNNRLVNKDRRSLVEFWDMSAKKSAFPQGQYVTSYDVETLFSDKWGASPELLMQHGLSLYDDVPAWSVSGMEMVQVFDWFKKRDLQPGENYLKFSGEVDVPYDVVDHVPLPHVDRGALASEAVLVQRLEGLAVVRDLHVERAGEYNKGTGYTFSFATQADSEQVAKDLARALCDMPHDVSLERGVVLAVQEPLDRVIQSCEDMSKVENKRNFQHRVSFDEKDR